MENIFRIVERKRNHWEEHKYDSNKDKYRICTYIHYYDNETYIGREYKSFIIRYSQVKYESIYVVMLKRIHRE